MLNNSVSAPNGPSIGTIVDKVSLEIDYEIIEHFSHNLYSSPFKAIEELVVNGFDAFATWVYVFLPSVYTPNKYIVWDNGASMDIPGLKALWRIADSPKKAQGDRLISSTRGPERKLIGKFGIGKIASYTLGYKISHLCKKYNDFYLVEVDYEDMLGKLKKEESDTALDAASDQVQLSNADIQSSNENQEAYSYRKSYLSPIRRLSYDEARVYVHSHFANVPREFDNLFSEETWTFAVISKLKRTDVTAARLKWIIGNGMPLRPDFKVWVEEEEVKSKLERGGSPKAWNLGHEDVKSQLHRDWQDAIGKGDIEGEISFGVKVGLDPSNPSLPVDYVEFPNLGKVWGRIHLYDESLVTGRPAEQGRSHGFFIFVRNRLINSNDPQSLLYEPSYGTFYYSQYILNVDELDEDLLADRERIQEQTVKARELAILERAVYIVTYAAWRERQEEEMKNLPYEHRLPVFSREYFMEPLAALWIKKATGQQLKFDFREPNINNRALGIQEHVSKLLEDGSALVINTSHPYHRTLSSAFGGSRAGLRLLKEFEHLAVSEELFKGYLYEIGIPDEKVDAITEWRDNMYRLLARTHRTALHQLQQNLLEASHKRGEPFEKAIVQILEAMGFKAERDGASGVKDVLMAAYCGDASYKFTFEAKGKNEGDLPNDDAEIAGAENHRHKAGAEHAVIVARRFAGFKKTADPAILQECRTAGNGRVSIMEVEALIELSKVMAEYFYPLDQIKEVFMVIETPHAKLERIAKLQKPLKDFDYFELLRYIWREQDELSEGNAITWLPIYQRHYRRTLLEEEFKHKLSALSALAYPLIQYDGSDRVALRQSPDQIAESIRAKLEKNE